jgi:hypothetical protein
MICSNQLAKIAFIRGHLIVPGVILFVFMGAWLGSANIGDWVTCLVFGTLGYLMKRSGWPRPPMVLALILGGILENALHISVLAEGRVGWLGRPIVMIIFGLILLMLFTLIRKTLVRKPENEKPEGGEGGERNAVLSIPLSLVFTVCFAAAALGALEWSTSVMRFPMVIAVSGLALSAVVLVRDCLIVRGETAEAGGRLSSVVAIAQDRALLKKASIFLVYLLAMVLLSFVVGQIAAICFFIVLYLRLWGGYSWRLSLGYSVGGWAVLYGFYGKIMSIFWMPSLFDPLYDMVVALGH